jgi:hypothetical protein
MIWSSSPWTATAEMANFQLQWPTEMTARHLLAKTRRCGSHLSLLLLERLVLRMMCMTCHKVCVIMARKLLAEVKEAGRWDLTTVKMEAVALLAPMEVFARTQDHLHHQLQVTSRCRSCSNK